MEKKRVLFVFQEITPYLPESPMSIIGRTLPQGIQEKGKEIRTLMPKFGSINERRNQLHEVIRLSGINVIINDNDHPLIIKVASIQAARMQIYFIDNEDYFSRKYTLADDKNNEFEDNDERAIFFARGVLETIIKLNWSPDIIHCHGWFTSLVGLYVKNSYNDNPLFANTKIVYSTHDDEFKQPLNKKFKEKLLFDGVTRKQTEVLANPDYVNVSKFAINNADGVIFTSEALNPELSNFIKESGKPYIIESDPKELIPKCNDFYDSLLK